MYKAQRTEIGVLAYSTRSLNPPCDGPAYCHLRDLQWTYNAETIYVMHEVKGHLHSHVVRPKWYEINGWKKQHTS